jgi:hypothetical protein
VESGLCHLNATSDPDHPPILNEEKVSVLLKDYSSHNEVWAMSMFLHISYSCASILIVFFYYFYISLNGHFILLSLPVSLQKIL